MKEMREKAASGRIGTYKSPAAASLPSILNPTAITDSLKPFNSVFCHSQIST